MLHRHNELVVEFVHVALRLLKFRTHVIFPVEQKQEYLFVVFAGPKMKLQNKIQNLYKTNNTDNVTEVVSPCFRYQILIKKLKNQR